MKHKDWNTVDEKTAKKEFNKWLDAVDHEGFRYSEKDDSDEGLSPEENNYKVLAGRLLKSIISGQVSFDEDYKLIFKLKNPIVNKKNEPIHTEIILKTELLTHEYNSSTRGIKSDDGDGRMQASICAFANMANHFISHLPYKENAKLQAAVSFLL